MTRVSLLSAVTDDARKAIGRESPSLPD